MNIIETVAPISIENLKKYFVDKETFYLINYNDSQLKGVKLLTYLSNLEIPCDINFSNLSKEDFYDLIKSYMESPMIVNLRSLELFVIDLLKESKGLTEQKLHTDFINSNAELITKWISKLDSLTLFNMYIIDSQEFKDFVNQFPENLDNSLDGVNFVSLLKHKEFYTLYAKINDDNLKFYKNYFDEYIFKGKNLYSYWANENNPLFLLTYNIAEGLVSAEEYVEAKNKDIRELSNVSSV